MVRRMHHFGVSLFGLVLLGFLLNARAQTPFIDEIEQLLDKPFFKMIDEINRYNLAPEIKRHVKTPPQEGGFKPGDKIIALTALAEYYIGIRDFPQARLALSKIDAHCETFDSLKPHHKARYHQARGVALGYTSNTQKGTDKAIRKGLRHFEQAEELFAPIEAQKEELFRVHFNKARHHLWLGEIDAAGRDIDKAKNLLPHVRQDGYKSAYYFAKSNYHLAKQEYQRASNALKKSRFFMNDLFKTQQMPELIEERLATIRHARTA